jgi:ribonuclease G
LSLPTRNLVYLPYARPSGVAVSKKITEPALRDRLKWMIEEAIEEKGGEAASLGSVIVRTNAANASVTELTSELEFLLSRQATLQQQSAASNAPALLLEELPLHLRVLRDWLPDRVEEVVFDDAHQYQSALEFAQRYFPDQRQHLRMTERNDAARWQTIERSIRQALDRVVTLSNGANLVFDYTAAMTVVDVNTASYLGDKNQQHTVLQTNLEAAQVLAQQIRLRNIGGIIIVDFIDMESVSDRRKLLQALQAELEHDPNPSSCAAKSDLGLIEISRQRGRASLMQSFQQACYCCKGTGWVRSPRAVSLDVINELSELAESAAATSFTVKAPPPIIDYLSTRLSSAVQKLRDEFEVSIDLEEYGEVSESPYHIQLG